MFENSIKLPKPIKFVHWIEPELSTGHDKEREEKAARQAMSRASVIKEEIRLRAQELAAKEAENRLKEQTIQLLTQIDRALAAHFEDVQSILSRCERKITALSFAIARKILNAEIKVDPEVVTRTVQKALTSINEETRIEIQVNPADKATVEEHWAELTAAKASNCKWTLETNASIGQGGCMIKTPGGIIDARIESQFSLIESLLEEHLNGAQEGQDAA